MWASVAVEGRLGIGKVAVWVEEMVVLPATVTSMGVGLGLTSVGRVLLGERKWPVVPVSATLRVVRRWGGTYKATDGVGGPTGIVGSVFVSSLLFAN